MCAQQMTWNNMGCQELINAMYDEWEEIRKRMRQDGIPLNTGSNTIDPYVYQSNLNAMNEILKQKCGKQYSIDWDRTRGKYIFSI